MTCLIYEISVEVPDMTAMTVVTDMSEVVQGNMTETAAVNVIQDTAADVVVAVVLTVVETTVENDTHAIITLGGRDIVAVVIAVNTVIVVATTESMALASSERCLPNNWQ